MKINSVHFCRGAEFRQVDIALYALEFPDVLNHDISGVHPWGLFVGWLERI